jgi:hypothetical protein
MRKKQYLFFLLLFCSIEHPLIGQKMFWSDMKESDKQEAIGMSEQFIDNLYDSDINAISGLLYKKKIFVGYNRWINNQQFIAKLQNRNSKIDLRNSKITAYTFDEFLDGHIGNDLINRTYEVFDNHSILVTLVGNKEGQTHDCILVIRKERDSALKITAVEGIFNMSEFPVSIDENAHRIEKISGEGIQIPIPKEFTKPDNINNQTIFYFEGKSGRDAVIQVMSDQLKARIYYYTYKFVEHSNQQFKMSNLIVRYIPAGILYEYEVIDPGGTRNKGITVGMEKEGKAILIQFYALMEAYEGIREQVNYTMANIQL